MTFVQIIEYRTSRFPEVEKLLEEWRTATEGQRTTTRSITGRDREQADAYVTVVEFPSFEAATRNNDLPATAHFAEQMAKLCDDGTTFTNLDVVRDEVG
jgi:hypothetical protein